MSLILDPFSLYSLQHIIITITTTTTTTTTTNYYYHYYYNVVRDKKQCNFT